MSSCSKCKKTSCNGKCPSSSSGSELANLENQVAELQDTINEIAENAKFLLCGHPIVLVTDQDDIDCFDLTSGIGSECWEGWALCNGGTHVNSQKKNFTTPNFTDRFIPMAGGNYAVGDTGGADSVQLTIPELPSHAHAINDPGHGHSINDPGHDHPVSDPGHSHGGSGGSHNHSFTTGIGGAHEHSTGTVIIGDGNGGDNVTVRLGDAAAGSSTSTDGLHSHTGTTNNAAASVTINNAFTGIDVTNAFTGITNQNASTGIVIQNTGGDEAHENRPSFFAALYVIKIG